MIIKRVLLRMSRMCGAAWTVFRCGTLLSTALLALGVLLTLGGHAQQQLAGAIYETVEAVWLIGILGAAVIEDQHSRR